MSISLNAPISHIPGVGPTYQKKLEKLGINSINDLIHHIPHRYQDYSLVSASQLAQPEETLTVKGTISKITNQYTKSRKVIQIATLTDQSGVINVIWFNQPFLVNTLKESSKVALSGKIGWFSRKKSLISPDYEIISKGKGSIHTGRLVPIYPETHRLTSKWLRTRIDQLLPVIEDQIEETLPEFLIKKHNLMPLNKAIKAIHFPKSLTQSQKAKRRLAFDELLQVHLHSLQNKKKWVTFQPTHLLTVNKKHTDEFISSLPFDLTRSQKKVTNSLIKDLNAGTPMNRLLQGDVGSGKTVIAAIGAFISFQNGFQTLLMAPTQILAQQHFDTLSSLFSNYKIRIQLITSATKKGGIGKADIIIGTHTLIHNKVDFDSVSLIVIDEQHKFGVEQRTHLLNKAGNKVSVPHTLTMTATPIPRTIALTLYGELDLSVLTELPPGKKPIKTWTVPEQKREKAYEWTKKQIEKSQDQVFVVCPLIEESESDTMQQVKSATTEYKKLKKIFSSQKVDLLHGKLSSAQKEKVIHKFRKGKTDILVTTPVVEVGIDIPNATIMIIETADRFGLAQLHQLRGRVGRGDKQSYCFLFPSAYNKVINKRLDSLQKSSSGAELAQTDLEIRGPGEILGTKQHGFWELSAANWQDFELIRLTKKVAETIYKNPVKYKKIINTVQKQDIH